VLKTLSGVIAKVEFHLTFHHLFGVHSVHTKKLTQRMFYIISIYTIIMNNKLVREFTFLVTQVEEKLKHESDPSKKNSDTFRLKNFKNFLTFLKKYPDEITSSGQLVGISNIGKGIRDRVDEILKKGKLSEVKRTKELKKIEENMDKIESLTSIIGIGEKQAQKYIKEGVISADDLKSKVKNGKIEVNSKIKMGLKYLGVQKTKIPRSEMDNINDFLQEELEEYNDKCVGILCGSYRREKQTSNDIDLLITHPKLKTMEDVSEMFEKKNYLKGFVKHLHENKFLVDDLTDKNVKTKYMGFCKYKKNPVRRIDIRFVSYDSYPCALLYFTGSGVFNTKMRKKAISKGMMLNEYGLYNVTKTKNGTKKFTEIPVKSEKDIFKKLNMEYVIPKNRN